MRTTPLLVLLLLVAPATGVQVDYPNPDATATPVEVDLLDHAGTTIDFLVDVEKEKEAGGCLSGLSEESDAQTATLTLTPEGGGASITLALGRERVPEILTDEDGKQYVVEHIVFNGTLAIDHAELVVGAWDLDLTVSSVSTDYDCSDDRELVVTAEDDAGAPTISFPTAENGTIRLGPGQSIVPVVADQTLGRVEYRVDRMAQFFLLEAPYIVTSKSFFPGENNLTIRATDRAGNDPTEVNVTVLVDGEDPQMEVDLLNRTTFYQGIDNPIVVRVNDTSPYRLTVAFQGHSIARAGLGGVQTNFTLGIPGNHTGDDLLRIQVVDAFGNTVASTRTMTVEQLSTDARIVAVEQVDEPVLVGENVTVRVAMAQAEGVANVTFELRLDGLVLGELEVPSRGRNETNLTIQLPPGRQSLTVQAVQPEGVLANAAGLTAKVPVEVFLARIVVGDDQYHVRSTPQGLPDGVVAPNGTVLATQLVDHGSSSVYAFQAGGEQYFWNPDGPTVQEFSDAEPPGGGNESPGVAPVLLVLTLLGLAVALRRR